MDQHYFDNGTKAGTAGGTILTILFYIQSADILKTAILAAVGALVSFAVTLFLKFIINRFKK